MRISDWSSDVCSSDLLDALRSGGDAVVVGEEHRRLVDNRRPDALVDLASRLKEAAHVLLKELRTVFAVERRQHLGRHNDAVRGQGGCEIERTSWRERGGRYVWQVEVGGAIKKR